MRKTDNRKSTLSSKGKSFKTKDANKAFKKTDKPKRDGGAYSERTEKTSKFADKPRRSFGSSDERKPYKKDFNSDKDSKFGEKPSRSFGSSDERKPFKKEFNSDKDSKFGDKPRRSFGSSDERKPFKKDFSSEKDSKFGDKPRRSFGASDERKPYKKDFSSDKDSKFGDKPRRSFDTSDERTAFNKEFKSEEKARRTSRIGDDKKPARKPFNSDARKYGAKPKIEELNDGTVKRRFSKPRPGQDLENDEPTKRVKFGDFEEGKVFSNVTKREGHKPKQTFKKSSSTSKPQIGEGLMRLNKYLSNAGVASRREADTLIQSGLVKVNGVVVDQLGYKINPSDKVTYGDAAVKSERKVYLLLNKPKDYITTVDDPQERKTVMELIAKACKERVYPVGRLDRNTTGLLLFTNDGEMTTKLTHPKFGVKKVYHVSLNKGLKPDDFKAISEGIELEDGFVKADDLAFVGEGKKEIGIEIHSGRNRIVRRLFEHLGYDVIKLDRVVFAGLTKKDLPRGKHRFLTAKEIGFLQMIG